MCVYFSIRTCRFLRLRRNFIVHYKFSHQLRSSFIKDHSCICIYHGNPIDDLSFLTRVYSSSGLLLHIHHQYTILLLLYDLVRHAKRYSYSTYLHVTLLLDKPCPLPPILNPAKCGEIRSSGLLHCVIRFLSSHKWLNL